MTGTIVIVSSDRDLHAVAVERELEQRGRDVELLACDALASASISYGLDGQAYLEVGARRLDLAEVATIWWRRTTLGQADTAPPVDPEHRSYVDNNCRRALRSVLERGFTGRWVSSPSATEAAEDKLHQLCVARELGLRVPDTLVSNDPQAVHEFHARHDGQIIVKSFRSSRREFLATTLLGHDQLRRLDPSQFRVVPNIYQEHIRGTQHLRVNCFGRSVHAARLETSELDWRPNLDIPIIPHPLDPELKAKILEVLDCLGLAMGIVDLKIDGRTGEPVWLEVNPQGQFLFLEPLTGQGLLGKFADFLASE